MALTTPPTAALETKWRRKLWREYVRDSGYKPYMGKNQNSIIHTAYEPIEGGKSISISLSGRATGNGKSGNDITDLDGNEEAIGQYVHNIPVEYRANAITVTKRDRHFNAADMYSEFYPILKDWCLEQLRDDITEALFSIDGTAYASASETAKDAWLVNNEDRVLFGSAVANNASNDHSASLANVDGTNDKLTAAVVSLAKRRAKKADPHIRPMRTGSGGREYFVMFAGSEPFRDLKADLDSINQNARPRNVEENPIFQDGDLLYDGVVIREVPEIAVLSGVGASSIDVAPVALCGCQAVGVAWGQMPIKTKLDSTSYGFKKGVGIEECLGVSKIQRDEGSSVLKDHGIVTVYVSGVADA